MLLAMRDLPGLGLLPVSGIHADLAQQYRVAATRSPRRRAASPMTA
jgi:hypothetical protein